SRQQCDWLMDSHAAPAVIEATETPSTSIGCSSEQPQQQSDEMARLAQENANLKSELDSVKEEMRELRAIATEQAQRLALVEHRGAAVENVAMAANASVRRLANKVEAIGKDLIQVVNPFDQCRYDDWTGI
ncbi:hypothetical protein PMAYCL1PPCAC_27231, partial [Pristionchus mayeri]